MDLRIFESITRTVTVIHPEKSFAIFSFTPEGSLFIDSDWGFYGHRWRGWGEETFVNFLLQISEDYFVKKLEINYFNETGNKLVESRKQALAILFSEFQKYLHDHR